MKKHSAAIFDLDGVIIDSMDAHRKGWQAVYDAVGKEYSEARFKETFGMKNEDVIPFLFGVEDLKEIENIATMKERAYREAFRKNPTLVPGIEKFIQHLQEKEISIAVASSAPQGNIDMVFDLFDFMDAFTTTVLADDVENGKPHPEVFLKAAEKLGAKPEDAVVFEDAVAGMNAGKAAGMTVIALTTSTPAEQLEAADLIVDDFTAPRLKEIF